MDDDALFPLHDGPPVTAASTTDAPVTVYESARATVWHGNALHVLPHLADDTIGLLLTDPPYGVAYQSGRGQHDRIDGDTLADRDMIANIISLCARPLRRGRHAYVFGPADLVREPFTAHTELIWDKDVPGMGDLAVPWAPAHERITFAVLEPSAANRDKGYGELAARLRRGSVLTYRRHMSARTKRHPTEKPVTLCRDLIESSSVAGDVILDPFAGSGSTGVAAILSGRRCVLVEKNAEYALLAARRCAEADAWVDRAESI